jgi:hypothetical protein
MCQYVETQITTIYNRDSDTLDVWASQSEDGSQFELLGGHFAVDIAIRSRLSELLTLITGEC